MKNLILFGASGHAKAVANCVMQGQYYQIIGIINKSYQNRATFWDLPFLGTEQDIPKISEKYGEVHGIVAVGHSNIRTKIVNNIRFIAPNFQFATVIHPNANIGYGVNLGPGVVVMPGVTINPDSKIGKHVVVNTNSSIDHDCSIGEYCNIAPNSALGGTVTVGDGGTIGIGASVIQGITIGNGTFVGAGSTVVKDLPSKVLAYGSPANIVKHIDDEFGLNTSNM